MFDYIDFSPARPYVGFTAGRNYNGGSGVNLEGFLPAESSYDVISRSTNDANPFVTNEASWQTHYNPTASGKRVGLLDIVNAAKAHGKKIALIEYAAQMSDCSANFSTSPAPVFFYQKIDGFLNANVSLVAWDTKFAIET